MSKLNYGDTFHFQNMYNIPRGNYLDLNNPVDAQEYYVTTAESPARDGLSGTWRIEPIQKEQGSEVKIGDVVKIRNASAGKQYLCAIPYSNSLATIQAVTNRIDTDESLQWEISVPNGVKGDTLEETSVFYLKNEGQQAWLGVYYGGPAGTSNAIYGVWGYKQFSTITQMQWRALVATSAPDPTPNPTPTPTLKTGRQSSWDVPENTTLYITVMNMEQWVRTVSVHIDGKEATSISLPAGGNGVVHLCKTGKSSQANGKNEVSISVDDSQKGHMMLEWSSPVVIGNGQFVNIGAEKDYDKETGFSDVAISVYWTPGDM